MRAAVETNFRTFNEPFEGWLPHMYLDREGYVTTGMGNNVDPISLALGLPWKNADGSAASQAEITSEWQLVKSRTDLEPHGGGAYGAITQLRLTSDDVTTLVGQKLAQIERDMRGMFPGWDGFPADAQMGILSMAWAMGDGEFTAAKWPKFTAAANAGDWDTAAAESQMAPTPGIVARNAANELLFHNAATPGIDPETLYYPNTPATMTTMPTSTGAIVGTVCAVLVLLGVAGWGFYKLHKGAA
jgi:GH24 family phage-related lysozyme (muramidase)